MMEQRGPFWNRFLSRIRRTNQNLNRQRGRTRRHLRPQNNSHTDELPYFNQVFKNALPIGRRLNGRMNSVSSRSSSIVFSSDFFNGMTNLRNSTDLYVPKVLSGVSYEHLLQGSTSVDNFSRNCWLENHLHRFGGININIDNSSDASSSISDFLQNSVGSRASSLLDLFGGFSLQTVRPDSNQNSLEITERVQNITLLDSHSEETSSNHSSGSGLAASDVSQYYQNMNLANATLNQQGDVVLEPPPYTENDEDPPPPYSEGGFYTRPHQNQANSSFNVPSTESLDNDTAQLSARRENQLTREGNSSRVSSVLQLTNQDILW